MAVKNLELPIFHFDDPATGTPLTGGKVYVYAAGTTTSINTWQDFDQTTLNANPVILDSYGNAKIWFDQTAKIVVKSSDDATTYFTFDDVSPTGGTSVVTGEYNLAQNGSFESANTDSTPAQWTASLYDPTASITVDTTNVTHGQYSAKFDGQTGLGCGILTSQRFDVTADSMLAVSLDTMASNATTTNDAILYWYQKDNSTPSATASTTLALPAEGSYPTSMTNYSFLVAVPSDATRAEIRLTGIDSGGSNLDADCYFDNIEIRDNQVIAVAGTSSPVTYLKASAGATGVNPSIASEGEANTGVEIKDSNGNEIIIAESVASAVNEVTVTNAAAASKPSINQTGSGDVGIDIEGVELHNGAIDASGSITAGSLVSDSVTAETTNGDLNLVRNGTGDITIDSVPIYGLVVLDTPVQLLNNGSTTGSWQQLDMSATYAAAATAGATKAILRITNIVSTAIAADLTGIVYIRKRGSGLSPNDTTRVTYATSTNALLATDMTETVVNLDSNSDFDWYQTATGGSALLDIVIVGYYV